LYQDFGMRDSSRMYFTVSDMTLSSVVSISPAGRGAMRRRIGARPYRRAELTRGCLGPGAGSADSVAHPTDGLESSTRANRHAKPSGPRAVAERANP
jgi:hypothetical protein